MNVNTEKPPGPALMAFVPVRCSLVLFRNGHDFDACCQLLNTIFGGGAGLVPLPHAVRMLGPRAALPVIVACGAFSFSLQVAWLGRPHIRGLHGERLVTLVRRWSAFS